MKALRSCAVLTLILSFVLGPMFILDVQAVGCISNCDLDARTTVPPADATVYVRLDNDPTLNNGTYWPLPRTFQFQNGTVHKIEVMNLTLNGASSGARYAWKQWSLPTIPWDTNPVLTIQMLGNYTFIAEFEKQFQLTLAFTDASGQQISPPSSITLQSGLTKVTTSLYSNQWYAAGVWSIIDAAWQMPEGAGMVLGTQAFDLSTGSKVGTVPLKAYPASVRVVDKSNNPIVGAEVTITFANATSRVFTTDGQGSVQLGHIPLGPYSARILYQNQDRGTWSPDASSTPVYTVTLDLGGQSNAPIVSALVLLTIFGVAMFLLLLAIKVRKPPPPPTI